MLIPMKIRAVFDAISSHRPYRTPMTSREALDYVAREAGGAFDPRIVWVFLHNFSERHQTRLAANA